MFDTRDDKEHPAPVVVGSLNPGLQKGGKKKTQTYAPVASWISLVASCHLYSQE